MRTPISYIHFYMWFLVFLRCGDDSVPAIIYFHIDWLVLMHGNALKFTTRYLKLWMMDETKKKKKKKKFNNHRNEPSRTARRDETISRFHFHLQFIVDKTWIKKHATTAAAAAAILNETNANCTFVLINCLSNNTDTDRHQHFRLMGTHTLIYAWYVLFWYGISTEICRTFFGFLSGPK